MNKNGLRIALIHNECFDLNPFFETFKLFDSNVLHLDCIRLNELISHSALARHVLTRPRI